MLLYNIRIATKSLRRNPILTLLLVGAIALGICVSTTFIALRHIFEKDPLPGKSSTLFYVQMDNWDPQRAYVADDPNSLPTQVTYRDGKALMRSGIPTRQNLSFRSGLFLHPDPKMGRPFREPIRLTYNDFFEMFNVPFRYGGPWTDAADAKPEAVVVINEEMNQKLFGGINSVGKNLRMGERDYKVVGVLARWRPAIKFYDPTQNPQGAIEKLFIPFELGPAMELQTFGNSDGWKNCCNDYAEFLNSESVWLQYWAELPTAEKQGAMRDWVNNYVREQKKVGRFERPLHTEVRALPELMEVFGAVPQTVRSMSIVSVLFLVVCSLNLVGLLLGKFLARIPEVSVRRALGASRWQVFWQHVVECELVGVIGGVLGLGLSVGMLELIAKAIPNGAEIVRLEPEMIAVSIFLSLVAGLMAGIYPAWKVCSVAPAMQLKVQ